MDRCFTRTVVSEISCDLQVDDNIVADGSYLGNILVQPAAT